LRRVRLQPAIAPGAHRACGEARATE